MVACRPFVSQFTSAEKKKNKTFFFSFSYFNFFDLTRGRSAGGGIEEVSYDADDGDVPVWLVCVCAGVFP
jgi:hypothetical protein